MHEAPTQITRISLKNQLSPETLVAHAKQGDRFAQEALYIQYVHKVTGVVAKLLRRSEDIEDVVQDTFIKGFRDLHQLRDPRQVGRWLTSIAVHRVHRRFRKRRIMRALGLDRSMDDERLHLQVKRDASQEIRAEIALLDRAFDAMGIAERTCWVLRVLEEHKLDDVAEIAQCSLATAKRRIARAQAIIDRHFEEMPHD